MLPKKEELQKLYFEQCMSKRELLKHYHIGQKTLESWFSEYGLEFRPLGTNQGHNWNYNEVKQYFADNGCELLSAEYKNSYTPLKYKCSCGNVAEIRFSVFKKGQRCKKCAVEKTTAKKRYTIEQVREIFTKRGAVLLSTEYSNAHALLEYLCPECGQVAHMSLNNFKKGYNCANCKRLKFLGNNNPSFNPSLSEYDRIGIGRKEEKYKAFRKSVFARDKQCVICGSTTNKNVHHLDGYANNPEKRTDINNAVTLCECCHKNFHSIYGYGNNTKKQFDEYVKRVCL